MCTFPSCFLSASLSWGPSCSVLLLPSCPHIVAGCGPKQTQGSCTRALCIGRSWAGRLCGSLFTGFHEPSLGWLFQPVGGFAEDDGLAFRHQPFNQAQGWGFPCRTSLQAGLPSSLLQERSCVLAQGLSGAIASHSWQWGWQAVCQSWAKCPWVPSMERGSPASVPNSCPCSGLQCEPPFARSPEPAAKLVILLLGTRKLLKGTGINKG